MKESIKKIIEKEIKRKNTKKCIIIMETSLNFKYLNVFFSGIFDSIEIYFSDLIARILKKISKENCEK